MDVRLVDDGTCSRAVIAAALKVHRALGPGLLESAYEACTEYELRCLGLRVERQVSVPLRYRGVAIQVGYRLDLLVERSVIVELKTVPKILPIHEAQLLSYLELTGYPVGLLINFHGIRLRDGIRRLFRG